MRRIRGPVVFVSLCLRAAGASAQGVPDEAARAELVRNADTARGAGDHARALDFALGAGRIRMTPSLQLVIAQEHHQLGHTADAHGNALACQRSAEADTSLRNRENILATCRALADATQTVASRPPPTRVVIVDPPSPPPDTPPSRGAGVGPWITMGVGVASFATAAVFYGLAMSARGERDLCARRSCEAVALQHDATYETDLVITNVALGVGAAAVLGGGLWWLLGRGRSTATTTHRLTVTPTLAASGTGLSATLSF